MTTPFQSLRGQGILIFVLLLATSCAQGPSNPLEVYVAERDSLRLVQNELELKLAEIEKKIAELDTTADKKLVTTYQPVRDVFRHYFEVYGNAETDHAASLYPETQGLITQILVSEGQAVNKGQELIRLDTEVLALNLTELRTSLDLATTLYNKQRRLWDQNIGSEVQLLEAKNRKESLENSIKTLEEQRSKGSVRAPFAGVVDKIFPKIGEMASGQMPLVRLINTDNIYINADISERYIGKVKAGDKVTVIANRSDTIAAEISRVGNYINPNNRTFEIRVNIEKNNAHIMPNSLVVLKINDYTADDAIAIPSSLIMQDGDGQDYVFVAEKNRDNNYEARKRNLDTGMRYLGRTLIHNGLDTAQPIIDKGSRSLRDGDHIELTNI